MLEHSKNDIKVGWYSKWGLIALGGLLHLASPLHAATISTEQRDGTNVIVVSGALEDEDREKFERVAQQYSEARVFFKSPGGSVLAGVSIGEAIRLKGFSTGVRSGDVCASACALAWLGGVKRQLQRGSRLGFHAAYVNDGDVSKESGLANAIVGAYLTRIGLPVSAVVYITKAGPSDMTWLSPNEGEASGIKFEFLDQDVSGYRPNDTRPAWFNPGSEPESRPKPTSVSPTAWKVIDKLEEDCDSSYVRRSARSTSRVRIPELNDPLVLIDASALPHNCGFTGTAGAPLVILANVNGSWVKAFDSGLGVRGYRVLPSKGGTQLRLDLHGMYCNKAGYEKCTKYLKFSGRRFE